jgi:hypothetical protein
MLWPCIENGTFVEEKSISNLYIVLPWIDCIHWVNIGSIKICFSRVPKASTLLHNSTENMVFSKIVLLTYVNGIIIVLTCNFNHLLFLFYFQPHELTKLSLSFCKEKRMNHSLSSVHLSRSVPIGGAGWWSLVSHRRWGSNIRSREGERDLR